MDTDMDDPTKTYYKHTPMDEPWSQIRILEIFPGDSDDIIKCSLAHAHLQDAAFTAISYTWGSPLQPKEILIDDTKIYVRENCYYALWQARSHGYRHVWIDSICIDQENLEEKSAQVGMMAGVYRRAEKVLACVGEHDVSSRRLVDAVVQIQGLEDHDDATFGDEEPWKYWLLFREAEYAKDLCKDLEAFGNRTYWTRLWIVQELSAGRHSHGDVDIFCGEHVLAWRQLEKLLDIRFWLTQELSESEEESGIFSTLLVEDYDVTPMEDITDALTVEKMDIGTEAFRGLLRLGCQSRLDKIYGLMSLINGTQMGIVVDYRKTAVELALEVLPHFHHDISVITSLVDALGIGLVDIMDRLARARLDSCTSRMGSDDSGDRCESYQLPIISAWRVRENSPGHLPAAGYRYRELDRCHANCGTTRGRPPIQMYTEKGNMIVADGRVRDGDLIFRSFRDQMVILRPHGGTDKFDFIGTAVTHGKFAAEELGDIVCTCVDTSGLGKWWPNGSIRLHLTKEDALAVAYIPEAGDPAVRNLMVDLQSCGTLASIWHNDGGTAAGAPILRDRFIHLIDCHSTANIRGHILEGGHNHSNFVEGSNHDAPHATGFPKYTRLVEVMSSFH